MLSAQLSFFKRLSYPAKGAFAKNDPIKNLKQDLRETKKAPLTH